MVRPLPVTVHWLPALQRHGSQLRSPRRRGRSGRSWPRELELTPGAHGGYCARAADRLDHAPTGDRPRLPAAQAPRAGAVVRRARRRRRTSSTRRRPRSGARPRCCSRSTRSRLVRGRGRDEAFTLGQYVNDRPVRRLVACSPWRIGTVFRTAMTGRASPRPELADPPMPLERPRAGTALPRRRRARPRGCSSRWAGRSRRPRSRWTRSSRVGRPPVRRSAADRHAAARRRAEPPVRAAAGARRRQALLGRARRGRQAAARRRGLAGRAPRAGAHHPPLPAPPRDADVRTALARLAEARRRRPRPTRRRAEDERRSRREEPERDVPLADSAATAVPGTLLREPARTPGARPRLRRGRAPRARCCRGRAFTEIVGVDVSARALQSPRAGCGSDRMPERQRDRLTLLPVRADLPRRPARRLRRRRADGGHRALDPPRLPALERACSATREPARSS